MRISDWSSDVCSSDLVGTGQLGIPKRAGLLRYRAKRDLNPERKQATVRTAAGYAAGVAPGGGGGTGGHGAVARPLFCVRSRRRSEEHTSELQSLMRISYAVFCLKKKKNIKNIYLTNHLQPITDTNH